ncbi:MULTISPECIES: flagellar basal body rod C-terminal domain-containing protein [Rheinheimera]|uniref:Flagellar basal body rod C-terminal domain-containing protein n=1 Tax=Rheinheimera marina TaxID=1774958 RepID=A0ABV9JGL0_9GAMM
MEISSAFSSGLQGYQRASDRVTEATININQQTAASRNQQQLETPAEPVSSVSVEQSLVDLNVAQDQAEANLKSVQTADEVLGSIIDIRV